MLVTAGCSCDGKWCSLLHPVAWSPRVWLHPGACVVSVPNAECFSLERDEPNENDMSEG